MCREDILEDGKVDFTMLNVLMQGIYSKEAYDKVGNEFYKIERLLEYKTTYDVSWISSLEIE